MTKYPNMDQENTNVNMNPGTGSEASVNPPTADNINLSGNQPFYFPQGNPSVVLTPVNTQNGVSLSTPQINSVPQTNPLDRIPNDGEEMSEENFHDASDFIQPDEGTFQRRKVSQRELASLGSVNAQGLLESEVIFLRRCKPTIPALKSKYDSYLQDVL